MDCLYDIILGLDILKKLGIKINCLEDIIEWNSSTMQFKSLCELKLHNHDTIFQEYDIPELIKKAEDSYDCKTLDNAYSTKDWKNAITKSTHLKPSERQKC